MPSESMWLILDTDIFRRAELKGVDADTQNVYLMLLLRAAKNPWWKKRPDVIPCDKQVLAKATGCEEDKIRDALNAFRKLGLVKLVKEKELTAEEDGSSCVVPTLEEVQQFASEEAPDVDAQKFYSYYAESGFMWKGKPVDWKQKLRDWQATEKPKAGAKRRLPTAKEYADSWERMYKSKGFSSMEEYLDYVLSHI